MRGRVFVEYDQDGQICRLFRNHKSAVLSAAWEESRVAEYARKDAIGIIRKRVCDLAEGFCRYCGKFCSWEIGEMHEMVPRGQGGEISIYNSVWSCASCHRGEHKNRSLHFGETDGVQGSH